MIDITIGNKTYENIPESYEEMVLGTYQTFLKRMEEKDIGEDFKEYTYFSMLSSLIGCSFEDILNLEIEDMNILQEHFNWLSDFKYKEITQLDLDGVFYTAKNNYSQLTTGEVISIETILKGKTNGVDNFHIILSILLRPSVISINEFGEEVIKQKDLDNFDDIKIRAKLFQEKLLITEVYGIINLFFSGDKIPTTNTKTSSGLKITKKKVN